MDTEEKNTPAKPGYLECGQIINVHGIQGAVKADPWCDGPEVMAELKRIYMKDAAGNFLQKNIQRAAVSKRFVLLWLEGVTTPEAAEALRGTVLYADRSDMHIDEGSFFIADLIGLPVIDADSGKVYGNISEVFNAGASDIYTVSTPDGERMIPAVNEFIVKIDTSDAVYVRPIGGMFD